MLLSPDDAQAARPDPESRSRRSAAANAACRVAIIGGGVAGLSCAGSLADHGMHVVVFDKGRGPGGRCSTRRIGEGAAALRFDHGAPFFRAEDPQFRRTVALWHERSVAAPWFLRIRTVNASGLSSDRMEQEWTGMPGMNAVVRHLAGGLDVRFAVRIARRNAGTAGHELMDVGGRSYGPFDVLVVSVPAPQAAELLADSFGDLAQRSQSIVLAPQIVAMVQGTDAADWDLLDDQSDSPLALAVAAHRKPGADRGAAPCWTLRGDLRWSERVLDHDPDVSAAELAQSFSDRLRSSVRVVAAHRWRYARCVRCADAPYLYDEAHRVGVCGDGFAAQDVEGAWLSGQAMASRLLQARDARPCGYPLI